MAALEETRLDLEAWYSVQGFRPPEMSISGWYLCLEDGWGFSFDEVKAIDKIVHRHGLMWEVVGTSQGGCLVRIAREEKIASAHATTNEGGK